MIRSLAVPVALALTGGSLAVGQHSASQRIDAAIAQLNARHTDSAEVRYASWTRSCQRPAMNRRRLGSSSG
jgi:hypothetical protein